MRISWYSNAPWVPTGYGMQTALFVPRLVADGHEVTIPANFGLAGTPVDWNGVTVVGTGWDSYSNDVAPAHHARWTEGSPGWMITLFDVWVLKFPDLPHVASWIPVDHLTVPPEVLDWARKHLSIAMSRFGQETLRKAGVNARYVPHAVDTSTYHPGALIAAHGRPWRELAGIPEDAFLIGIVGANKGWPARKGFGEMYSAAAFILERHPDAHLYVHSDIGGFQGCDLAQLQAAVGLPADRVHYADQFALRANLIPPADMAAMFAGFDVLLSTSYGEGFGIPVLEAAACGVPAIVTDATAQPELAPHGWRVPGQAWWNAPQRSWWVIPNVAKTIDALEEAYVERGTDIARGRSEASREFAVAYDIERVYAEFMRPVVAELEDALRPKKSRKTHRYPR